MGSLTEPGSNVTETVCYQTGAARLAPLKQVPPRPESARNRSEFPVPQLVGKQALTHDKGVYIIPLVFN